MAWRIKAPGWSVGMAALVAFAPTQIHMSQHAMIDGFFAFWAVLTVWLLWENLQSPGQWPWLIGYALAFAALVLTKETAFFVWLAIVLVLVANRWLQLGRVSPGLIAATVLGPALGGLILIVLAGGPGVLIATYQLFVTRNYALPYVIKTFDGPWQRYLIDLLLVSPIITLLAVGAMFRVQRSDRFDLLMLMFVGVSYFAMCNVKYGMNLRFANMWDVPLRFLALGTLVSVFSPLRGWRILAVALAVALIGVLELRQYEILFVDHSLYELSSDGLLRALNIVR
jgi:4-amino-4-deoxy-L-arabinose transferase-like glycosyltransferase